MNVLITAPSLNITSNVSGISSVVGTIIDNNPQVRYLHFIAGRDDRHHTMIRRMIDLGKGYLKLINIFRKNNITLVHQNLPLNPKAIYREFVFFSIAKLFNKKVLLHIHGGKYLMGELPKGILKNIISHLCKGSNAVVCLSDIEKTQLEKTYGLKDVQVMENTVDASYLRVNSNTKTEPNLKVLFLGRLDRSKGLEVIFQTIDQLMNLGCTHIEFIFAGTGPMMDKVIETAKKYPVYVSYAGVVSGGSKKKLLSESNIFVLPSLYGEGLPMSLLEAMATGLVPIVTDDGSMSAVVKNFKNGFIIEKNDSSALASTILLLAADPERLANMSAASKQYAVNNFSINQYISHLNGLYRLSVA